MAQAGEPVLRQAIVAEAVLKRPSFSTGNAYNTVGVFVSCVLRDAALLLPVRALDDVAARSELRSATVLP